MSANYLQQRRTLKKNLSRIFQYIVLSIVVLIVIIPIVMLIFGALKTRGEFMTRPYTLPIPPNWENFAKVLSIPTFWTMLLNSFLVMLATTSGVVIICSLAAFALSRMKFRGQNFIFNFLTLGLMFPVTIAILPVYLIVRQIGLTNNLWGVILVQTAFQLSIGIVILRGFFKSVPYELQDAAYIDGCNAFGFFWRIMLPLTRPALAAIASLTMVASWNDLLVPLVLLNNESLWTLPLGTMQFQGQYGVNLALVAAFVILSAVPAVIFYLFAERQIISGLTAGAIKG
ncbi:MAG: carbohydrate ABC transporter permease [Candidatus Atribacteria bacterium]|nr:carbohydrate ABC transporter permease [Candidatus Atribacteria bacterium]